MSKRAELAISNRTMLRKLALEHGGERYEGTIRNLSASGAMIEGLWNVPKGITFNVQIGEGHSIEATTRWSQDDRIGVEFATRLKLDEAGKVMLETQRPLRKPGEGIGSPVAQQANSAQF